MEQYIFQNKLYWEKTPSQIPDILGGENLISKEKRRIRNHIHFFTECVEIVWKPFKDWKNALLKRPKNHDSRENRPMLL